MKRYTHQYVAVALAAPIIAAALGGCSIGPLQLPDFQLPIGTQTSVADARAERQQAVTPAIADSDLKEAGTLTVGILSTSTAPFSIQDANGSYTGIDVDTAHALADQLGLSSVKFVDATDVSTALTGSCDIVMGVTAGNGITGDYTVVGNYAQGSLGIFGGSDTGSAPIDATALDGKRVGVQAGSATQVAFSKLNLTATVNTYANLNECFDALSSGDVDFVVCDTYAGAYLAGTYENATFAGTFGDVSSMGIAVSTASTNVQSAVQSALDAIQTNGVANIARSRWVGTLPTLGESTAVTGLTESSTTDASNTDGTTADGTTTDGTTDSTDGTSTDATSDSATDGVTTGA